MIKHNYDVLKSLIFMLILMLLTPISVKAQTTETLVGENVPDATFREIVNYTSTSAKISDFKGKLLILDFWASWCSPCVAMFPKMDSLEKQFAGKIQVLPITKESEKKVVSFLNHMYKIRHIRPFSVVNDTLFSELFKYSQIPYYVWIDSNGKVIANTGAEEITAKNIDAVLKGQTPTFENRNDIQYRELKVTAEHNLFVLKNNFNIKDTPTDSDKITRPNILSYSIATKYISNAWGQLYFDEDHFTAYNVSIEHLYRWAYNAGYYDEPTQGAFNSEKNHVFVFRNQKLLDSIYLPKSIKSGTKEMDQWEKNYSVSYEMVYPKGITWKAKMKLVREDLDRSFSKPMGFKVHVEKRIDSNSQVLKRVNNHMELSTTGGIAKESHDRYMYIQHNMPLSHFTGLLKGYFFQDSKISFIDECGINENVDLELSCDMNNLESINEALDKYGLKFIKKVKEIDVLVFSDGDKY